MNFAFKVDKNLTSFQKNSIITTMKRVLGILFCFLLVLTLSANVFAQSSNATIPEKNGDYPDPKHPGIRVRVFVHEPKEKPSTPTFAFCDNPQAFVSTVGATGWKLPTTGDWKYKVNTSSAPSSVSGLASIVSNSFGKWTNAITSSSKPNLVDGGTTLKTRQALDFENIITWGRTQGSALGVTYVWYYTATKEVADVDTIMNKKFPWSLGCNSTSYNAEDILVHELGHWFGLDDEYGASYVDDTMYGYGSKAEIKKITPENGDKDGINAIYR